MRKYDAGNYHVSVIHWTASPVLGAALVALSVRRACALKRSPRKLNSSRLIRFLTTTATNSRPHQHGTVGASQEECNARRAMISIIQSPGKTNHRPWTNLLEPFLPPNLQRKAPTGTDPLLRGNLAPVPMQHLHIWLAQAREMKQPKGDLLTYLAVKEDRHDAVVWLVQAMLQDREKNLQSPPSHLASPRIGQRQLDATLDEITATAENTEALIGSATFTGQPLDAMTGAPGPSSTHECLGEIWRSVGSMILQAADRKPTSAKSKAIMACVYRLLAHLHHVGAVPSSIYNPTRGEDATVLQRPPTLYLWSLRIMTVLSDAHWRHITPHPPRSEGTALMIYDPDSHSGAKLPSAGTSPLLPDVEPQIWLDFVLWCCVEGGWTDEAAGIVYDMSTRPAAKRQYSVIDWNTLRKQTAPGVSWSEKIRSAINKSRMREFAGGATFGTYDERAGLLKPPERTVSSEVIAAIVDALASTALSPSGISNKRRHFVEEHISVCKGMLDRQRLGLGFSSWDSAILRMLESPTSDSGDSLTTTEPVLSWASSHPQESGTKGLAQSPNPTAQPFLANPSPFIFGLLHRLLLDAIKVGSLSRALRVFQRLQDVIDAKQQASLAEFQAMITKEGQLGDTVGALDETNEQPAAPGSSLQLPANVLALLLDIITDSSYLEMGGWLLHSEDVDGRIIPSTLFSNSVLQPALIRFASTAGDEKLLENVTQQLKPPLSEAILRALLHHQLRHQDWVGANEILELFRDGKRLAWDASDVVAIAQAYVHWRNRPSSRLSNSLKAYESPEALLGTIMRGQYNKAQNPSLPRNLSQVRMLNQLARIIASVPSFLHQEISPFYASESQLLSASCEVPVKAFNMLLASVVGHVGVLEGKRLCERWCVLHNTDGITEKTIKNPAERIVKPDIQTFYTILRPISQARTQNIEAENGTSADHHDDSHAEVLKGSTNEIPNAEDGMEDEQEIMDWAVTRCLGLGLGWDEIQLEFPGLVTRKDGKGTLATNDAPYEAVKRDDGTLQDQ
ncbi:MAG: hypothetical protein Q9222_000046 [Ikaeria aurantiellina]